MTSHAPAVVSNVWNFTHVLRDEVSYDNDLEQIIGLLFLKMTLEQQLMLGKGSPVPMAYNGDPGAPALEIVENLGAA